MTVTEQQEPGANVDRLDLEPIVYKLMHPHPGEAGLSLAEADRDVALYRCFLKLCAWYPGEPVVPSRAIDAVWHAHILDTAKYLADCETAFGRFMDHFPYLGLRGEDDFRAWNAAYARTRELFMKHFSVDLPEGSAAQTCHNGGSSCNVGGAICSNESCERAHHPAASARPRPDRAPLLE